jgi:hypothetical protein
MLLQYVYDKFVENRPDDIIWGELIQVGLSSLGTDLIVKTFLDFSSLYSNPVLEAGIFAVADYYALLLMKNEKLFLDESKYKSGRNSE